MNTMNIITSKPLFVQSCSRTTLKITQGLSPFFSEEYNEVLLRVLRPRARMIRQRPLFIVTRVINN